MFMCARGEGWSASDRKNGRMMNLKREEGRAEGWEGGREEERERTKIR
jgi:hypothetical protein